MLVGRCETITKCTVLMYSKDQSRATENCFSVMRSQGGFCDNPDSKKFADAYKHVMIKSCMLLSELGNLMSIVYCWMYLVPVKLL